MVEQPLPRSPSAVRPFVAGLLVLGGAVMLFLGVRGVVGAGADQDLAVVDGRVEHVQASRRKLWVQATGANRATHETVIEVDYSYEVQGQAHRSRIYAFDEKHEAISNDDEARARLAQLTRGSLLPVYYDPSDPRRAVLSRREMAPAVVSTVLGAILAVVGAWLALGWYLRRRNYLMVKSIRDGSLEQTP